MFTLNTDIYLVKLKMSRFSGITNNTRKYFYTFEEAKFVEVNIDALNID